MRKQRKEDLIYLFPSVPYEYMKLMQDTPGPRNYCVFLTNGKALIEQVLSFPDHSADLNLIICVRTDHHDAFNGHMAQVFTFFNENPLSTTSLYISFKSFKKSQSIVLTTPVGTQHNFLYFFFTFSFLSSDCPYGLVRLLFS